MRAAGPFSMTPTGVGTQMPLMVFRIGRVRASDVSERSNTRWRRLTAERVLQFRLVFIARWRCGLVGDRLHRRGLGFMSTKRDDSSGIGGPRQFETTRWTMVRTAGDASSPDAEQALTTLCRTYWYPLYAYLRREGHAREDARDLTQAFFVKLLEEGTIRVADPRRGKFRSFLLASLKHFVSNQLRRERTAKRGLGRAPTSLDFLDFEIAEGRYAKELAHAATPEQVFERRWAFTVLEQVVEDLRREYADLGKARLFSHLKPFLGGDSDTVPYREIATELDMTEGSVKVAVHRLRRRCRALLLSEIAHTVADPADVEGELRHWRTLILSEGV